MGQIKRILGNNIRRLRNSRGWTQAYLADVLELTPSFLTLVESGQRGMSLEVVESTADVFHVPIASLFIDHDAGQAGNKDQPMLRNVELRRLRQQLGDEIQKVINTSIEGLLLEEQG